MMILYLPRQDKKVEDLLRRIEEAIPEETVEIFVDLNGLVGRLRRPRTEVSIVVLDIAGRAELMKMISIADLIEELRLVLVLPEDQPDILEKAHVLHPRFIVATEDDFQRLGGILKNMVERYGRTD